MFVGLNSWDEGNPVIETMSCVGVGVRGGGGEARGSLMQAGVLCVEGENAADTNMTTRK